MAYLLYPKENAKIILCPLFPGVKTYAGVRFIV